MRDRRAVIERSGEVISESEATPRDRPVRAGAVQAIPGYVDAAGSLSVATEGFRNFDELFAIRVDQSPGACAGRNGVAIDAEADAAEDRLVPVLDRVVRGCEDGLIRGFEYRGARFCIDRVRSGDRRSCEREEVDGLVPVTTCLLYTSDAADE